MSSKATDIVLVCRGLPAWLCLICRTKTQLYIHLWCKQCVLLCRYPLASEMDLDPLIPHSMMLLGERHCPVHGLPLSMCFMCLQVVVFGRARHAPDPLH